MLVRLKEQLAQEAQPWPPQWLFVTACVKGLHLCSMPVLLLPVSAWLVTATAMRWM